MGNGRGVENAVHLYRLPLFKLMFCARSVHRDWLDVKDIQRCLVLSIKTGGCPGDGGYCSQSLRHAAGLQRQALLSVEEALAVAWRARERFCMGAAWRSAPFGEQFDRVLQRVREVKAIGLEACAKLGEA